MFPFADPSPTWWPRATDRNHHPCLARPADGLELAGLDGPGHDASPSPLLAAGIGPDLAACLARSAALHHHLCPRQVLGVRMGLYAGSLLDLTVPQADKRLVTFVETDGCFADGVAAATGCWLGRRTLRLMDYGKAAATFVDTLTGQAIRLWPHPQVRQRASVYADAADGRWRAQLIGYQRLPADELLRAAPVTLTVSLAALLSQPGRRVFCAGCGEEIMNEREVVIAGQPYCRACAGDGYYAARASARD